MTPWTDREWWAVYAFVLAYGRVLPAATLGKICGAIAEQLRRDR